MNSVFLVNPCRFIRRLPKFTMDLNVIMCTVFAVIGLVLLLHHGWTHWQDDPETSHAQKESCVCVCYFQPKDISHYETWAVVCLTNSLSIGYLIPVLSAHDAPSSVELLQAEIVVSALLWVIGIGLMVISRLKNTFSFHNLANHETWIIVCLTNAASFVLWDAMNW